MAARFAAEEELPPAGGVRLFGFRENIVYVAGILMFAAFSFLSPYFLTAQNLQIIAVQAAAMVIVACGVTYVIVAGDIDLSVGSMYALAGTLAAILMHAGMDWTLAVLVVLLVGTLLGLVNGSLVVRAGIPAFLVTLGTLGIVRGLVLLVSGTRAVPIVQRPFADFFAGELFGLPRPIWWALLAAVISGVVLARSVYGRYVYAVGGDREASRLAGIPVGRVRMANFVLSGFLAAFAGLLVAGRIRAGQPTIGGAFELDVITAVILGGTNLFGGRGHILGTVAGAVIITIVGNGLILIGADANVQTIIKGTLLIAAVLFRTAKW